MRGDSVPLASGILYYCLASADARACGPTLLQQPKDSQGVGRPHEHFPTADCWRNEFVTGAELVTTAGGLVAVVKLVCEVRGVVRMQHRGCGVLVSPDNGIGSPAR